MTSSSGCSPLDLRGLLMTLESKSPADDKLLEAYTTLGNLLKEGEPSIFDRDIVQFGPKLVGVVKKHVQSKSLKDNIQQKAIIVLGYLLGDREIVGLLSVEEPRELLRILEEVVLDSTEKFTCSHALWCVNKQKFPHTDVAVQLPSLIKAINKAADVWWGKSVIVEHACLIAITRLYDQCEKEMCQQCGEWLPLMLRLLVSGAPKVQKDSMEYVKRWLPLLSHTVSSNRECLKAAVQTVIEFIEPELTRSFKDNKPGADGWVMKVCNVLLTMFRHQINQLSLINSLLKVLEVAFKRPSEETRGQAFRSWRILIDAFAEKNMLSEPKYMSLLLSVFKTRNTSSLPATMTKLTTWWHFVRCLGLQSLHHFDKVLKLLLQFCLGNTRLGVTGLDTTPGTPNTPRRVTLKTISPPPAHFNVNGSEVMTLKTYPEVINYGLEILAHLLHDPSGRLPSPSVKFTLEPLKSDFSMTPGIFLKNAPVLISALFEFTKSVEFAPNEALLTYAWQCAANHMRAALDTTSSGSERHEALTLMLGNFQTMVLSQDLPPRFILKLFQMICTFPSKVLSSAAYSIKRGETVNSCPAQFLFEVLLTPRLLKECDSQESFMTVFSTLIGCGSSHLMNMLVFCQRVASLLDNNAQFLSSSEVLWRMWSMTANALHEHILKTNEVNQGDSLEYNFDCMYAVLLLPITHRLAAKVAPAVHKTAMKTWTDLYQTFARLSALVANAEANSALDEMSQKILETVLDEGYVKDGVTVESLLEMCHVMVETVDFSALSSANPFMLSLSAPASASKKSRNRAQLKALGNLHSFVTLFGRLVGWAVDSMQSEAAEKDAEKQTSENCPNYTTVCNLIMDTTCVVVLHINVSTLISPLMQKLAGPLGAFFATASHRIPAKVFSSVLLHKVDKLWQDICTLLQDRYKGCYDDDLLGHVSPLLLATFVHSRRYIKSQTVQLWNATFGQAASLNYPTQIQPVLGKLKEKTTLSLPGWINIAVSVIDETPVSQFSQMDSQAPEPVLPGIPPLSPARMRGSFLNKDLSPARKSASPSPVKRIQLGLENRTHNTASARRNLDINFMSDKDFVVISNTPKKRRILTEHQKEMMREKRVIPAMYNTLDASQDRSLLALFHSDNTEQESLLPAGHSPASDVIVVNSSQSQGDHLQAALQEDNSLLKPDFPALRRSSRRRSVRFEDEASKDEPPSSETPTKTQNSKNVESAPSDDQDAPEKSSCETGPSLKSSSEESATKSSDIEKFLEKSLTMPTAQPNVLAGSCEKLIDTLSSSGREAVSLSAKSADSSLQSSSDERKKEEIDPFFRPFKNVGEGLHRTRSMGLDGDNSPTKSEKSVLLMTRRTRSQDMLACNSNSPVKHPTPQSASSSRKVRSQEISPTMVSPSKTGTTRKTRSQEVSPKRVASPAKNNAQKPGTLDRWLKKPPGPAAKSTGDDNNTEKACPSSEQRVAKKDDGKAAEAVSATSSSAKDSSPVTLVEETQSPKKMRAQDGSPATRLSVLETPTKSSVSGSPPERRVTCPNFTEDIQQYKENGKESRTGRINETEKDEEFVIIDEPSSNSANLPETSVTSKTDSKSNMLSYTSIVATRLGMKLGMISDNSNASIHSIPSSTTSESKDELLKEGLTMEPPDLLEEVASQGFEFPQSHEDEEPPQLEMSLPLDPEPESPNPVGEEKLAVAHPVSEEKLVVEDSMPDGIDVAQNHKNLFGFAELLHSGGQESEGGKNKEAENNTAADGGSSLKDGTNGSTETSMEVEHMEIEKEEKASGKEDKKDSEMEEYNPHLNDTLRLTPPHRRTVPNSAGTDSSQNEEDEKVAEDDSQEEVHTEASFDPLTSSTLNADKSDHAKKRKQQTPKRIAEPQKLRRTPRKSKGKNVKCACCRDGDSSHHQSPMASAKQQNKRRYSQSSPQASPVQKKARKSFGQDSPPSLSPEPRKQAGKSDEESAHKSYAEEEISSQRVAADMSPQEILERTPEAKTNSTPLRHSTTKQKKEVAIKRKNVESSLDKQSSDSDSDSRPLSRLSASTDGKAPKSKRSLSSDADDVPLSKLAGLNVNGAEASLKLLSPESDSDNTPLSKLVSQVTSDSDNTPLSKLVSQVTSVNADVHFCTENPIPMKKSDLVHVQKNDTDNPLFIVDLTKTSPSTSQQQNKKKKFNLVSPRRNFSRLKLRKSRSSHVADDLRSPPKLRLRQKKSDDSPSSQDKYASSQDKKARKALVLGEKKLELDSCHVEIVDIGISGFEMNREEKNKQNAAECIESVADLSTSPSQPIKGRRGRPRKKQPDESLSTSLTSSLQDIDAASSPVADADETSKSNEKESPETSSPQSSQRKVRFSKKKLKLLARRRGISVHSPVMWRKFLKTYGGHGRSRSVDCHSTNPRRSPRNGKRSEESQASEEVLIEQFESELSENKVKEHELSENKTKDGGENETTDVSQNKDSEMFHSNPSSQLLSSTTDQDKVRTAPIGNELHSSQQHSEIAKDTCEEFSKEEQALGVMPPPSNLVPLEHRNCNFDEEEMEYSEVPQSCDLFAGCDSVPAETEKSKDECGENEEESAGGVEDTNNTDTTECGTENNSSTVEFIQGANEQGRLQDSDNEQNGDKQLKSQEQSHDMFDSNSACNGHQPSQSAETSSQMFSNGSADKTEISSAVADLASSTTCADNETKLTEISDQLHTSSDLDDSINLLNLTTPVSSDADKNSSDQPEELVAVSELVEKDDDAMSSPLVEDSDDHHFPDNQAGLEPQDEDVSPGAIFLSSSSGQVQFSVGMEGEDDDEENCDVLGSGGKVLQAAQMAVIEEGEEEEERDTCDNSAESENGPVSLNSVDAVPSMDCSEEVSVEKTEDGEKCHTSVQTSPLLDSATASLTSAASSSRKMTKEEILDIIAQSDVSAMEIIQALQPDCKNRKVRRLFPETYPPYSCRGMRMVQQSLQQNRHGQSSSSSPLSLSSRVRRGPSTPPRTVTVISSPSESPTGGILKRRVSLPEGPVEGSDDSTPSKRRRVSFSEPLITGESPAHEATLHKMPEYFQGPNPSSTYLFRSRRQVVIVQPPGNRVNQQAPRVENGAITSSNETADTATATTTSTSTSDSGVTGTDTETTSAVLKDFNSPSPASQVSQNTYQSTEESQLNNTDPFYPALLDCTDSAELLLPQLTSPAWHRGLSQLMKARGLTTVGHLARLTEVDINTMPLRAPKLDTARRAMSRHLAGWLKRTGRQASTSSGASSSNGDDSSSSSTASKLNGRIR